MATSKILRTTFLHALKAGLIDIKLDTVRQSVSRDRIKFTLRQGVTGQIYIILIRADGHPGGFDVYSGLILEGGPIATLLRQLGTPRKPGFGPDVILNGTSYALIPGRVNAYTVRATDEPTLAASIVLDDIRTFLIPLIAGFSGDWATALDFALRTPEQSPHPYAACTPSPFAGALVLAALANRPDRIPEIAATAQSKWFNDATAVGNPVAFFQRAQTLIQALHE
jgi:hypothetical protein